MTGSKKKGAKFKWGEQLIAFLFLSKHPLNPVKQRKPINHDN